MSTPTTPNDASTTPPVSLTSRRGWWHRTRDGAFRGAVTGSVLVGLAVLVALILQSLVEGWPKLNWSLITSFPSSFPEKAGIQSAALQGNKSQGARTRALTEFKDGKLVALVATDIAARGIDIDDVAVVIHYAPPLDVKTYLHRSGRTARAGKDGWAVTMAEYNQHTTCRIIQRGLRLDIQPPIEVFSNDVRLRDLFSFLDN